MTNDNSVKKLRSLEIKITSSGMTLSLNNGRLTPTEMQLQTGLESTLNTCSEAIIGALVQENKVVAKKKRYSGDTDLMLERIREDETVEGVQIIDW